MGVMGIFQLLIRGVILEVLRLGMDVVWVNEPAPDLSAESTPTGGWCQMKQVNIFFGRMGLKTHSEKKDDARQTSKHFHRKFAKHLSTFEFHKF